MSNDNSNRITLKLKTPNPIFLSYLEEFLDYAIKKNLKSRRNYEVALESLKRFPLPLNNPNDCLILEGFGPTLCGMIAQRMKVNPQLNNDTLKKVTNVNDEVIVSPKKKQAHDSTNASPSKRKKITDKPKSPKKCTKTSHSETRNETDDTYLMSPNDFEIILIVDTQETSGKAKRVVDQTMKLLEEYKIKFEVRKLSIGDFLWICRDTKDNELILPYIIERKRVDDFASSIRDGRYHEQAFRLKQCGLENIIYLIESCGNNQHLPMSTLLQASVDTQIHNNFQVKFTDSHTDSILYLATLTEILLKNFKDKVLISCPKAELKKVDLSEDFISLMKFNELNLFSSKTKCLTVRDIFIKQLLQLKLLSVDKVLAIVEVYPTPRSLIVAYKNCESVNEAENLLANIRFGAVKRSIGPLISKIVYQFYNLKNI